MLYYKEKLNRAILPSEDQNPPACESRLPSAEPSCSPQGQGCVSERVGPKALDALEAFREGLAHREWELEEARSPVCPSVHPGLYSAESLGDPES